MKNPKTRAGRAAGESLATRLKQFSGWRDQYNPLVGLAMERVRALLEAGQRGEMADLQWTYRLIEERYATLFGLIDRRTSPILEMSWKVRTVEEAELPSGTTTVMADAQAEYLKECYGRIDNMTEAVEHLAMATFRGYAHLQKQDLDGDGEVDHLEVLDQWNFVRRGLYGNWWWNPDAKSAGYMGLPAENEIKPGTGDGLCADGFIIREVKRPVNPIGLEAFVRQALAKRDWAGFVEIFGIPGGVVIGPPNVPENKESEYQTAGERIAEGGSGYLPNGSDFKYNDSPRGGNPFREFLRAESEDVVLAGTGGLLTMLAESGSGTLAGGAHTETFNRIARAEAKKISGVFQKQCDALLLRSRFPGQPALAHWELCAPDETAAETLKFKREVFRGFMADGTVSDVLANQTDFKQLTRDVELPVNEEYVDPYLPVADATGNPVTGEVVKDKEGDIVGGATEMRSAECGVGNGDGEVRTTNSQDPIADSQDPEAEDQGPKSKGQGPKSNGRIANRAGKTVEAVAGAVGEDLGPVMERLGRILLIRDDGILEAKLREFLAEFPQLEKDVLADPRTARVLEGLVGDGVLKGIKAES